MTRLSLPFQNGHIAVPPSGDLGIFRASAIVDYGFYPKDRIKACQSFKPASDLLNQLGMSTDTKVAGPFSQAIVHVTRSKIETLGLIATAILSTDTGGFILVDGAKTDGVDSILKRCKAHFEITESISKSHGRVFWFARPATLPDCVKNWQNDAAPSRKSHGFMTAPGMFSVDKIDQGSVLLAENMSALKGKVADIGAGWGWLSDQVLTHEKVTQVDLFEAEQIALNAARQNVIDPRTSFHWQDVLTMEVASDYDVVVSNPPFHQTRAAEPAIGLGFIAKAAEMLKSNGVLWLVANRQLPYESKLAELFVHTKPVRETAHFKVLCASRPLHHRKRR